MTNVERWRNLGESWDARIKRMAVYIQPYSSVLDLGAGQMALKKFLPEGCVYVPCDLVARDPATIVCDFNQGQFPPSRPYDYVVCSGLIEYLHDVPGFFSRLKDYSERFIVSYAVKIKEQSVAQRRKLDWVNDYTLIEMVEIFHNNSLAVKSVDQSGKQRIFYLEKAELSLSAKAKNQKDVLRQDFFQSLQAVFFPRK